MRRAILVAAALLGACTGDGLPVEGEAASPFVGSWHLASGASEGCLADVASYSDLTIAQRADGELLLGFLDERDSCAATATIASPREAVLDLGHACPTDPKGYVELTSANVALDAGARSLTFRYTALLDAPSARCAFANEGGFVRSSGAR
jgi:hypothetical protein